MHSPIAADQFLSWVEVDLDAIAHNLGLLLSRAAPAGVTATVKANAYGHGAVAVSRAAVAAGATRLAVYNVTEGVALREAGITVPILVLGYSLPAEARPLVAHDLTPIVNSESQADALSAAAVAAGRVLPVHVKVDTGLGRYGLLPTEVQAFVERLEALPGLECEGLCTHYAMADEPGNPFTRQQFAQFTRVAGDLASAGFHFPLKHVANSAATLQHPDMALDMVRTGIALYGLRPGADVAPDLPLRPALAWKSRLVRIRTLPAGSGISYGHTFVTDKPTRIALVPVGYGDGYHRSISNRGEVLVRGRRAPIVGRICMDQFAINVDAIPAAHLHDEVVLIGAQGADAITADEVARWARTINYEVVTAILPRVPRLYLRNGAVAPPLDEH